MKAAKVRRGPYLIYKFNDGVEIEVDLLAAVLQTDSQKRRLIAAGEARAKEARAMGTEATKRAGDWANKELDDAIRASIERRENPRRNVKRWVAEFGATKGTVYRRIGLQTNK